MKVHLPEIKRCCFCIPLRYGLIAWGYIKMALILLTLVDATTDLFRWRPTTFYLIEQSIWILCLVLDVCFDIVFLIGGHRKIIKLMHIYYIYSIVILCIFSSYFTLIAGYRIYISCLNASKYAVAQNELIPAIRVYIILDVLLIVTQIYMILLTKIEIKKLRNDVQFRFTNVAAEAERTLENGTDKQGNHNQGTDHQMNGTY